MGRAGPVGLGGGVFRDMGALESRRLGRFRSSGSWGRGLRFCRI